VKNKSKPEKLKIIGPAIVLTNGMILSTSKPHRHHDLINLVNDAKSIKEQGFILSNGTFSNRKEAGAIAIANKQINKLNHPPNLFTEDLY
jgi:hypothetical protein